MLTAGPGKIDGLEVGQQGSAAQTKGSAEPSWISARPIWPLSDLLAKDAPFQRSQAP